MDTTTTEETAQGCLAFFAVLVWATLVVGGLVFLDPWFTSIAWAPWSRLIVVALVAALLTPIIIVLGRLWFRLALWAITGEWAG